jgi:hypothetical protein
MRVMSRIATLLSLVVLTLGSHATLAANTKYAVGTCEPKLTSFSTIQAALNATPPPTVVEVCPGTYQEQVVITQGVSLEGVSNGTSDQAIIASPAAGLVQNTTSDFVGELLAVQLWVNNASGPVTITNITVDAAGNRVSGNVFIVGVFYQNSAGTVKEVTTRNQEGNGFGTGVWLEGGSSNPSVTLNKCSIHDFDSDGIETETNASSSELTATLTDNNVISGIVFNDAVDVGISSGSTVTATGNVLSAINISTNGTYNLLTTIGFDTGFGAVGSLSGNVITNTQVGISANANNVSITSNKLFNTKIGIAMKSAVVTIKNNAIMNAGTGIQFSCGADNNVISNTISDAGTGLSTVPASVTVNNTFFNVGTISADGC